MCHRAGPDSVLARGYVFKGSEARESAARTEVERTPLPLSGTYPLNMVSTPGRAANSTKPRRRCREPRQARASAAPRQEQPEDCTKRPCDIPMITAVIGASAAAPFLGRQPKEPPNGGTPPDRPEGSAAGAGRAVTDTSSAPTLPEGLAKERAEQHDCSAPSFRGP